jgi:nucleotide-binding universal stress UspA family protein
MNFGKKVVVAVDMHDTSREQLKQLKDVLFLKDSEIHFVHVYQTTNMAYGLGEFCQVLPVEPDRKSIEQSVISSLIQSTQDLAVPGAKSICKCLFDENPKEEFCLYAKEVKADTMVIFTRQKHGIFESSFAQYAARHSPCHVLILKP